MKSVRFIALLVASALSAVSCSTTRLLGDGQYRLAANKVTVEGDASFRAGEVSRYIKQKPNSSFIFGWNPFLSLYNLSGRDTSKVVNRIIRSLGTAPVIYDEALVAESVENIGNHLEYIGWYNSAVESKVSVSGKKVTVDYNVRLGDRYRISRVDYAVPAGGTFGADFLSDTANVTVRAGDWLSESALEDESQRSAGKLRNMGYYGLTKNNYFFSADTLSRDGCAALEMRVNGYTRNESPENDRPISRYAIGKVSISYPRGLRFKEKVLREMNILSPGETFSEDRIQRTYSRFSSLRTFSGVNMELTPRDTADIVDCDIKLTQAQLNGIKAGIEVSSNSTGLVGISPQLNYYNRNIFRGGEWLNVGFMGNFQFRMKDNTKSNELGVNVGVSFPRLMGLPHWWYRRSASIPRTEINASYNFQDRPEYLRNIVSTSFGYSGVAHGRLSYQVYPLQLSIVRLYKIDPGFYQTLASNPFMRNAYQDHFDLGTGLTLYYTTNTDVIPKSTYHYMRLQADLSGVLLSLFNSAMRRDASGSHIIWGTPYSEYVRVEASAGQTWVFGKDDGWGLATRVLAGFGHPFGNSSALPFEKQFYSGGANSLRGWQARSVGPGDAKMNTSFSIPSQTGEMKLEANVELRFPMFWKFAGAVFADAGNVWTVQDIGLAGAENSKFSLSTFGESVAADWGVGLRLDLSFILLRLDYGMRVHDPSQDGSKWVGPDKWFSGDCHAVHFGVGYPF